MGSIMLKNGVFNIQDMLDAYELGLNDGWEKSFWELVKERTRRRE